jgi:hypothetical protein
VQIHVTRHKPQGLCPLEISPPLPETPPRPPTPACPREGTARGVIPNDKPTVLKPDAGRWVFGCGMRYIICGARKFTLITFCTLSLERVPSELIATRRWLLGALGHRGREREASGTWGCRAQAVGLHPLWALPAQPPTSVPPTCLPSPPHWPTSCPGHHA